MSIIIIFIIIIITTTTTTICNNGVSSYVMTLGCYNLVAITHQVSVWAQVACEPCVSSVSE